MDGKHLLSGIVCANITPFTKDGQLDIPSLRKLCGYLAESGINSLFPLGTNGEGILMTVEERKAAAEVIVSEVRNRIPVILQCGAMDVERTTELALHARAIHADGVALMTPYFFGQDDQALYEYYTSVAGKIPDMPVYIYNISSHTNNDVKPALAARIADAVPNVVGIKFSCPDLIRLGEYIRIPGFDALIGCDRLIIPALTLGAKGGVSGPAAIFPELFRALWSAWEKRDLETARALEIKLFGIESALAGFPGIPLIKAYLKSIGVIETDVCRSPFRKTSEEEAERMCRAIAGCRR